MKNKNLLIFGGLAILLYLLSKKKKTAVVKQAGEQAAQLVAKAVENTTFIPDTTTAADIYNKQTS